MIAAFTRLFEPLQLGPVRLRNRLLMPAMTTGFGYDHGRPEPAILDFFRRRTAEVGMAVVAFGAVAPEGRVEERIPWMWNPDAGAALAPLAAAIREAGAVACLQLGHGGRQVSPRVTGMAPVGPSNIRARVHVEVEPRQLSTAEVDAVVEAFAVAAGRAAEAGFQALELHAAHGYLVQQFLDPATNRRRDRYREPLRFATDVVTAIRRAAPSLSLVVRINGSDLVEGGIGVEDAVGHAVAIRAAGAHALAVSAGVYGSVPYTIPLLDDAEGAFLPLARRIREAAGGPVIGVGRVTEPATADDALRRGDCDAVAIGRALLADPDWVAKARAGRTAEIRPCIATVQGCAGMLQHGGAISCAVNPDVGREPVPAPARLGSGRRVVVVGGGVAGMEAARRAAEMGCGVILFERASALGGQLRLAAATPPLAHLGRLVAWYEGQLRAAGVEVRLGREATGEADLVVVATGAAFEPPQLPGYGDLPAWTGDQLAAISARRPAILGGDTPALAVALALVGAGSAPTVIATDLATDNSGLTRRALVERLRRAGVTIVRALPTALVADGVMTDRGLVEADGAVIAGRRVPVPPGPLPSGLQVRVGDVRQPRGVGSAIAEARDALDGWARLG